MPRFRLSSTRWLVVWLALAGVPGRAFAQAGDKAAAEVLFNEGRALMQEGKLDLACDRLAESQRLDPGAGTLLNLAECRERQGRTATAWATWLEAAAAAHSARQNDREAHARKRADALKPRLVTLTLEVPEANRVEGLEVSRDGVVLGPVMWGVAVPVDPGAHKLSAKAPGRETWTQTVNVAEGAPARVAIPALAVAAVAPPPAPGTVLGEVPETAAAPTGPSTGQSAAPLGPQPPLASEGPKVRKVSPLAYVAAGVGVVGIGVGSVFGLRAISKNKESKKNCSTGGTLCNEEGMEDRTAALDSAKLSNGGFIIGGIGLAAAVAIWATAPKVSSTPAVGTRPGVRSAGATVLPGGAAIAVEGAF